MGYVLLLAVLATLPVFVTLLRRYPHRRNWAIAAIAIALFLGNIRTSAFVIGWPAWPGPVRGLEVSLIDMLALALILTRAKLSGRLPFWGVIAFYGFVLALSVLLAAIPMASGFAVWQFGRLVLLFAALGGEFHRLEALRALVAGLAIGGLIEAGFVIQQKLGGAIQASGNIGHQNMLGMMVELALLPILASLLAGDRRKIVMAGAVGFLIVIAGGGSRGTVAFAALGIVVLMLLSFARSRTTAKFRVAGIGVLALAVAAPLTLATLQDRFGNQTISTADESREALKRAARAISADYPFGIGANQYVNFANKYGYSARAGVEWGSGTLGAPVHHSYLLARVETGWLGEVAFILLLVIPMLRGLVFAFRNRDGPRGEIVLGASIAISLNIAHNNFEYVTHSYNVFAILIINMAVIAALLRPAPNVARRPSARPMADRPLTPNIALSRQ